jgi:hypothetical protein
MARYPTYPPGRYLHRDGRPRVIRKVVKTDSRGRAKRVRDRKIGVDIERVKARGHHPCGNRACPHGRVIEPGVRYAKVILTHRRRFIAGRSIPEMRDYHFDCLPEPFLPMVRFFTWTGAES